MNPETILTTINPMTSGLIKGVYNVGTHINFIKDEGQKYYLVELQDEEKKKIILPEWFIKKFFSTDEEKAEDVKIISSYKKA